MDELKNDEEAETEQETSDDHELKVIKLNDHMGESVGEPSQTKTGSDNDLLVNTQPKVPAPASTDSRSIYIYIYIHLDNPGDSAQTIRSG